jgi:hypothetical protein
MSREDRKIQYRNLVEQGKIKPLFLQPWWLDATGPWDVSLAIKNERVIGALPFAVGKKWGISYLGMPSLTHHLPIWMEKPADITAHKWLTREKQIIWSLIDDLPPHGYFSLVFEENSFDNWLPFHWKGFRQEVRYTFVIDRTDDEALESRINSSYKKKIRKASSVLRIERDIDPKAFYEVCSQTFRRQKIPVPFTFEKFLTIDDAVNKHSAGLRFGAFNSDGKLVAVSSLLWDDRKAYYYLSGDEEEGRELGASILLCREAIRIAFEEKNLETFDFCGSMLEPITEIRRQFGARTVPLMKIFKANYKWLDLLYRLSR